MRLDVDGLTVTASGAQLVIEACLTCEPGQFTALVGPNGSGKSTLLKTVYRALTPTAGQVMLDGRPMQHISARRSAQVVAAVTQESGSDFEFTVADVVTTGRLPHKGALSRDTTVDREIIADALDTVGMTALAGRVYASLSGGEKQRVLLARALAQQPRLLILDEPTNHLDVATQLDLLELVASLGITVLAALHDLNHAAAHAHAVYVLREGAVIAHGPPGDVLNPQLVADVFHVHAHRVDHPATGGSHLILSPLRPPMGLTTTAISTPTDTAESDLSDPSPIDTTWRTHA